jgi:hypothetical protein
MRYVVARYVAGGIGDHLTCLIGAWWIAKKTNRTLVIDWRGSRFNTDKSMKRNCFFEYFQSRPELGGVKVIADDSVADLLYPSPIWPAKWTLSALASPDHVKHTKAEVAEVDHLVTDEGVPPAPTIVLNQGIHEISKTSLLEPRGIPPRNAVKRFLDDLRPVEWIQSKATHFWDENIGSSPTIAIHIRHGNGENIGARAAYWLGPIALIRELALIARTDVHRPGLSGRFSDNSPDSLVGTPDQANAERRFCRNIADKLKSLSAQSNLANAKPFLFCDSEHVVAMLREYLPTLVVCPKHFLEKGAGPLHQFRHGEHAAEEITREMFIELELMRRCGGLIYTDSGFSILTRIKLDGPNMHRLRPGFINRLILKFYYALVQQ